MCLVAKEKEKNKKVGRKVGWGKEENKRNCISNQCGTCPRDFGQASS